MNLRESIKRILNESVPPQVRRRQGEFDRIFLHYRDSFIGYEYTRLHKKNIKGRNHRR